MTITNRLAGSLDTATAEDIKRQRKIADEHSGLAGIHETKQAPKHGPVRQHLQENVGNFDYIAGLTDLLDSLFEQQDKTISKAHGRITAAYDSLDARIDRLTERHEELVKQVGKLQRDHEHSESDPPDPFVEIARTERRLEKRLDDLADRLSLVHVQARGDAKIRAKHWLDIQGSAIPPDSAGQPKPQPYFTKLALDPAAKDQPITTHLQGIRVDSNQTSGIVARQEPMRDDKAARLDELQQLLVDIFNRPELTRDGILQAIDWRRKMIAEGRI